MSSESLAQAVARNSNWINTVISNSKLSSQLSELVSITSLDQKIVVQEGVLDAKYANVKSIRGYKGLWNATTNIPTLSNSSGVVGDVYKVSVAGNINIGSGSIYYVVGDLIYLSEDNWIKISPNQISDITGLQLALDSLAGGLIPQGNWNALSNVPDIGTGATTGQFWIVSVAGSTNVGGITDWEVNDWAVRTATGWAKIDNTDKVLSVAGRTGVIVLGITDITGLTAELANTVKLTGNQSIAGQKTFTELVTMTDRLKLSDSAANTLIGDGVGTSLTTGAFNVGVGFNVLQDNTVGTYNVGLGDLALHQNTEGSNNFAGGTFSMWTNSTGSFNVAIGFEASRINTTGSFNVAIGSEASKTNTTGENNIGIGKESLWNNRTGSHNIGVGLQAGKYIANGVGDNRIPQKSIFIGQDTRANADGQTNQIVIGDTAIGNGSNTVTLGNNSIATTYLKGDVNITGSITGGGGDFLPLAGGTLTGALTGTSASFVGNVITDGIFKVDSAPDNNILEVTQSGRKMALKTSFAGDAVGSFWAFRVSNGNVNGSTTDALIVKPQQATFAGNVQLKGTTPTLEFFKTSAGDVLANIKVESGAGTGGKLTIQTKRNGNTAIDALVIDEGQRIGIGTNNPDTKLKIENNLAGMPSATYATTVANSTLHLSAETVPFYNHLLMGVGSAESSWIQSQHGNSNAKDLLLNPIGGNVGIGTDSPSAKLEVDVASGDGILINSADIATFKMKGGGAANWGFATTNLASGDFGIYKSNASSGDPISAGTPQLYIKSDGNVGIGETNPLATLDVHNKNGGDAGSKSEMQSNAVLKLRPHATNSTNMLFSQLNSGSAMGITVTNSAATANWDIALNPFGGNVAIGTDNPSVKLHVKGTTIAGVEEIGFLEAGNGTVGSGAALGFANSGFLGSYPNWRLAQISAIYETSNTFDGALIFKTSNAANEGVERMRITSAGFVGIGEDNPTELLHLKSGAGTSTDFGLEESGIGWRLRNDQQANDFILSSVTGTFNTFINRFVVKQDGNVGIGTDSPDRKLVLDGALGTPALEIKKNTDRIVYLGTGSSDAADDAPILHLMNQNVIKVNLSTIGDSYLNGGNVGIGTTTPLTLLNLEGVKNTSIITLESTTNDASWSVGDKIGAINFYSADASGAGAGVKASMSYEVSNGGTGATNALVFNTAGTATGTNNTERMRIDSAGNVGIGTTDPTTKLTIEGAHSGALAARMNIYYPGSQADQNAYLDMWASEPGVTYNGSGIGSNILGTPYYGKKTSTQGMAYIRFVNGIIGLWTGPVSDNVATERIRVESGGNLLIGVPSISDATSRSYGNAFAGSSANGNWTSWGSGSHTHAIFRNATNIVGTITTSGSATTYNTSSDYRLKEDLQDFGGLDMVSKIPVYNYKWKSDESRSYGVMAHELQEVLPNAVSGEKDAEEMQGVDYSKIVPLLIKSIQELTAKVEILEAK